MGRIRGYQGDRRGSPGFKDSDSPGVRGTVGRVGGLLA